MHLRGPMNVSQLAVYQIPSEALKMRKRDSVPFYNRQRALKQRNVDAAEIHHLDDIDHPVSLDKRTWTTTSNCGSVLTVTSTVVVTDCRDRFKDASASLPNTTYVGPSLTCLPTPDVRHTTAAALLTPATSLSDFNCTFQDPMTLAKDLERQPKVTPLSVSAQASTPTIDTAEIRKRAAAWSRVAHYTSAAPAEATGFSFLANLGDPQKSGTFD